MKRMIKYPSIEQFRNVVKTTIERACYIGKDEEGVAIFDYLKPKPTIKFSCTEKIHGINAGVCYSKVDGLWIQSRERIIDIEKDNMGFAFFIEQNREVLISLIENLAQEYNINLETNIISLYGEWAGGNIQKNSALSGYEKVFILFEYFKVTSIDSEESQWYRTIVDSVQNKIYNINNFEKTYFEIDFNEPEKHINNIIKLVDTIEDASPLGKRFGFNNNIGEGVVCSYLTDDNQLVQFKVKGEKHSKSPVKTLTKVDTEKLSKVEECLTKICHNWRFEQGLIEVFGSEYENKLDRSKLGNYIKWVTSDTIKEESDIIVEFGFEPKDVLGKVSQKAKEYFFAIENNIKGEYK